MADRKEKSSGEGIITVANVLQIVLSVLCVLVGGAMIVVGAMANSYFYSPNLQVPGVVLIVGGILSIIVGLVAIAIEAMFVRCYGEIAVDLRCIRKSNAAIADFFERADIARQKKEQQ